MVGIVLQKATVEDGSVGARLKLSGLSTSHSVDGSQVHKSFSSPIAILQSLSMPAAYLASMTKEGWMGSSMRLSDLNSDRRDVL